MQFSNILCLVKMALSLHSSYGSWDMCVFYNVG
jgi:hypothetical protein